MSEGEHEDIMTKLDEIKEVLIGTYEKKGIISRIATLEKYMKIIGSIAMVAVTGAIGNYFM